MLSPMPHNSSGLHDNHGMTSTHEGMSAFLFSRTSGFFVLFQKANIQSTGGFIAALVAAFFFATFSSIMSLSIGAKEKHALNSYRVISKFIASILFGVRSFLHYISMLLVMTMNIWLILVVVAGHALGFFVYGLFFAKRSNSGTKAEDV